MGLLFSGTTFAGVVLGSVGDNPVTIAASAYLGNTVAGEDALAGLTVPGVSMWTITNSGQVAGDSLGILLLTGGTVVNKVVGTIVGAEGGMVVEGVATVMNAGYIVGPSGPGLGIYGGGQVTNQSSGTIVGGFVGIGIANAAGTVTNAGVISGTQIDGMGIDVSAGGSVINLTTGTIAGVFSGIDIAGAAGSVTNAGVMAGTMDNGIYFSMGGGVTNLSTGTITGGNWGIYAKGAAGSVTNAGIILGGSTSGIALLAGGGVTNLSTGTITGGNDGIEFANGTASVTNAGYILGTAKYGVLATDSGYVTNQASGTISSEGAGIDVTAGGGGVTNSGIISGVGGAADDLAGSFGVVLQAGGEVLNHSTGTITGGTDGLFIRTVGFVVNGGVLYGTASYGVQLSGGFVSNQSTGTIGGGLDGIYSFGTYFATITNAGLIQSQGVGVLLYAGPAGTGDVENDGLGFIYGVKDGVFIDEVGATLTNAGTIFGFTYGARLAGGSVTNQSSGTIGRAVLLAGVPQEAAGGVHIDSGDGTVVNAGLIEGTAYAVQLGTGFTNRVIADPGGVFVGTVSGGAAVGGALINTLELASGATVGQISGLGTQFINFEATEIDAGAQWTLTGMNTQASGTTLTNAGALTISGGGLNDAGAVVNNGVIQDSGVLSAAALTGTGEVQIGDEGTLTLTGPVVATQTIAFGGTGLLALTPAAFAGQIDGLGGGGRIELIGVTSATSAGVVNGNTLAIQQSAGPTLDLTLDPTQSYAGVAFPIATLGGVQFVDASEQVGPTVIDQGETESVTGGAASTLAAIAGAVGGITVTGSNSLLTTTTGPFIVGDAGPGSLSIAAGGAVTAMPGSVPGLTGVVIANTAGASGSSVSMSGAHSTLGVTGALIVGAAGEGSLSVSQGAAVTAVSVDEASAAGGDGVITVAGTGSALTLTGSLTVGDQAAGEVSILNGATVSAQSIIIGDASSLSSGNVDVEGAGSELFVGTGGVLNVGFAGGGSGELTIGPGTTLHSNAGVIESGHASYNNNGGAVDPPFVDITTPANAGLGSNLYDLYVENIDAVQIVSGTGTWDTPMMLTGTSVADAQNNINVNGDQGEWQLSSGGTLIVNANTVDSGQAFVFEDATDTLTIGQIVNNGSAGVSGTPPVVEPGAENVLQAGGFAGEIWGYVTGDQITFDNMSVTSASVVNGNTVDLFGPGDVSLGSLAFFTKTGSKTSNAGAAAAALQIPVQCFAAGTRIETVDGWVRVDDLRVGDRLVTADGGNEPIVWIGQRSVNCRAHPRPETVWPVRIKAGALGDNVPARDLYLSPDHAVFVNDVLIPVRLLVNGTSIKQVGRTQIVYYHVQLPEHDVILAEGLPAESYLDTGDRANFDGNETVWLFPDFAARPALDTAMLWEARGAAPFVTAGSELTAARHRVRHGAPRGSPDSARLASQAG